MGLFDNLLNHISPQRAKIQAAKRIEDRLLVYGQQSIFLPARSSRQQSKCTGSLTFRQIRELHEEDIRAFIELTPPSKIRMLGINPVDPDLPNYINEALTVEKRQALFPTCIQIGNKQFAHELRELERLLFSEERTPEVIGKIGELVWIRKGDVRFIDLLWQPTKSKLSNYDYNKVEAYKAGMVYKLCETLLCSDRRSFVLAAFYLLFSFTNAKSERRRRAARHITELLIAYSAIWKTYTDEQLRSALVAKMAILYSKIQNYIEIDFSMRKRIGTLAEELSSGGAGNLAACIFIEKIASSSTITVTLELNIKAEEKRIINGFKAQFENMQDRNREPFEEDNTPNPRGFVLLYDKHKAPADVNGYMSEVAYNFSDYDDTSDSDTTIMAPRYIAPLMNKTGYRQGYDTSVQTSCPPPLQMRITGGEPKRRLTPSALLRKESPQRGILKKR